MGKRNARLNYEHKNQKASRSKRFILQEKTFPFRPLKLLDSLDPMALKRAQQKNKHTYYIILVFCTHPHSTTQMCKCAQMWKLCTYSLVLIWRKIKFYDCYFTCFIIYTGSRNAIRHRYSHDLHADLGFIAYDIYICCKIPRTFVRKQHFIRIFHSVTIKFLVNFGVRVCFSCIHTYIKSGMPRFV